MPIIPDIGRKKPSVRLTVAAIYLTLTVLGLAMVAPFLITLASSMANDYDYDRFHPAPKCLWSESDRFMKGLVIFFNNYSGWEKQMRAAFPSMPRHWSSWRSIGSDDASSKLFSSRYLNPDAEDWKKWKNIASDYSEFSAAYPIGDTVCAVVDSNAAVRLGEDYESRWKKLHPDEKLSAWKRDRAALELLNRSWDSSIENFQMIRFNDSEMRIPMWQQSWYPGFWPKFLDFQRVKEAYRDHRFTPGVRRAWLGFLRGKGVKWGDEAEVFPVPADAPAELVKLWRPFRADRAPASPAIPYSLRTVWYDYLQSADARELLGLPAGTMFDIGTYNAVAGTHCGSLYETPFPIPVSAGEEIRKLWRVFLAERYPLRLMRIEVSPEQDEKYRSFLKTQYKSLEYVNRLLGTSNENWNVIKVTPTAPPGENRENMRNAWMAFVKTLPLEERFISSSEIEFQKFLLSKYGSVNAVNEKYGWNLKCIEEAFPPFDIAYAVTFKQNERAFLWEPVAGNYSLVWNFLILNASAVPVTVVLIVLAVVCSLTVNPLAAYALSRFNMRGQDKIILFMLATMAFPAMVSAIPAYLLMRDIGMLNTFFALVLPSAANGMAIFILKGFFDSLPAELFEAATIDGANEWQIFRVVAMPLVKPILAINALNAFIAAYNGWEWALIICQKKSMWTIAGWLYQANNVWWQTPWITMAGFVVASIPTLLVFILCQKMILRGIILPTMK
ncbi:MAG: carbohydrate ABC transporter permease [Candidatus Paceibacterota bacterium]|jgi:ABC-type glycerol-3-phosphate transport system permease component